MNLNMKLIWLLKSDSLNKSYENILKENNFSVETIPTLDFDYINKVSLEEALCNPADYSGIVFTSVRGVESVSNVFNDIPGSCIDNWRKKRVFVVGKATNKAVFEKLNLQSMGEETGNAKQLGPLIVAHSSPSDKPLLYICGNLKRDELSDILKENNRDFKIIVSYKTIMHQELETKISELYATQKPDYIVFYSPSGIEYSLPIFRKLEIHLTKNNFIALGPTTKNALMLNNMNVFGVCSEPTPTGLIDALNPS